MLLRSERRREVQEWSGTVGRADALQENAAIGRLDDGEGAVPVAGLVPGPGAAGDPSVAAPARFAAVPHEGAEDDVEWAAQADAAPGSKTITYPRSVVGFPIGSPRRNF